MNASHARRALTALLLGIALAACGSDAPTTITSTSEGIVDQDAPETGEVADDVPDPSPTDDAQADDVADTTVEPEAAASASGTVTLDGVEHTMARIDRCNPTEELTERVEAIDGIDSLEVLSLVANGDGGMFQLAYSDAGVRSVTLSWNGADGSLDTSYSQVADGADWIDAAGTTPDGELLEVVDGVALGGATIDGRDLRFRLPIPDEATC